MAKKKIADNTAKKTSEAPTDRKYEFTEAHKAQIPAYREKWLKVAMDTTPMNDNDRKIMRQSIDGLMEAAGLKPHGNTIFVASPLAAAVKAGAMVWVAFCKEHGTNNVTVDPKTDKPAKPLPPILQKYLDEEMVMVERELGKGHGKNVRQTIAQTGSMRNPGNHGAPWCCYYSFVRDIIGVELPAWEKYKHYENACLHGSHRYMHRDFCVMADRPTQINTVQREEMYNGEKIMVHHPFNDNGPTHLWSDGFACWYIDGIRLPFASGEKIVMHPETQTPAEIDAETNNDIRQIRLNRFGVDRYLVETGAEVLAEGDNPVEGTHESLLRDKRGTYWFWPTCPSGKGCPPLRLPSDQKFKTLEQARAWLQGDKPFNTVART